MEFEKAKIPDLKRIRASKIFVLFFLLFFISTIHGEELSSGDWSEMGNAQVGRGEYEEAVKSYDRAIGLDNYNPYLWYNKGLALTSLGRYEEALYCYHRATNIKPFDAEIWMSRGAALSALGRYEEALECYDRAVKFDSKNADAWNNKGTILTRVGQHEEALECYGRAVEIEPSDADAWNNRGSALHQLGRYQEALECYNRAIELDPLHEYAWHNKGLLVPTLDEESKEAFALSRKRIYVEAEPKNAPLFLFEEEKAAVLNAEDGTGNEKIPGWRLSLVIVAILVAGLLLNPGEKGRGFYINSLQSSLSRLVLMGDRSTKRR